MKQIQLSHGGGGVETNQLIQSIFFEAFGNDVLLAAEDAAVLHVDKKIAFTTDSFTVSPVFFNGGDIGKISIAGTVNDLAVMGAKPLYLSAGFIIEEGLPLKELETIVQSMNDELARSGARIVCGDTKVVPRGSADKIFINTAGIGGIIGEGISAHNIEAGDAVLVSRDIGTHGATILAAREGMDLHSDLKSDCASVWAEVEALIQSDVRIKAMRDATRGGLAAVLNEWAQSSEVCLEIREGAIPVCDEVRGICELLGFEPYDFANEGTFIVTVSSADAQKALECLQAFNSNAAIIGSVTEARPGRVILKNDWGSSRYLELPKGELLPRIC